MEHLARIGFSQSYTYFTWRTIQMGTRDLPHPVDRSGHAAYFRPNLWPNTPDILPAELVDGGRGAFLARLVLAATLSASYGIYGPVFELQEHIPRRKGPRSTCAPRSTRSARGTSTAPRAWPTSWPPST